MNFDMVITNVAPKLRQLAVRYKSYIRYCDADDLYGEMVGYLWEKWQNEGLRDKTESYIVQACYFHIRNYIRTLDEHGDFVNLDNEQDREGVPLKEILPDTGTNVERSVESSMLFNGMMHNGLSKMEKLVCMLLYHGHTVREIGEKLSVSHTMIVKHKKNILKKVSRSYDYLLV